MKFAVIHYSATGHGTPVANRAKNAAESLGAEVRVRHIANIAGPEVFDTEAALEHLAARVVETTQKLAS